MKQKHITKSVAETLGLGEKLGVSLKSGDVVALCGGLGAGKTVLAKGIAKGLGVKDEITSPTFTLLRQYHGRIALNHFDLYRIEDDEELEHIGFYDYLGTDSVCVIEWPENAPALKADITIAIKGTGEDDRIIEWTSKEAINADTVG